MRRKRRQNCAMCAYDDFINVHGSAHVEATSEWFKDASASRLNEDFEISWPFLNLNEHRKKSISCQVSHVHSNEQLIPHSPHQQFFTSKMSHYTQNSSLSRFGIQHAFCISDEREFSKMREKLQNEKHFQIFALMELMVEWLMNNWSFALVFMAFVCIEWNLCAAYISFRLHEPENNHSK